EDPEQEAEDPEPEKGMQQHQYDADPHQGQEGQLHGALAADDVVDPGEGKGAQSRCHVKTDAEEDDLVEGHAEGASRIDGAEGEDGVQAVVVEQPGEQEAGHVAVAAQVAAGLVELAQALSGGSSQG